MILHRNVAKYACSISSDNVKYIFLRKPYTDLGEIYPGTVVDNIRNLCSYFDQGEKNYQMNGEY